MGQTVDLKQGISRMIIKVLNLISSPFGLGGAEKLLLDLHEFYDRQMFEVHYCNLFDSPSNPSAFSGVLKERGLSVFEVAGHRWYDLPGIVSRLGSLIRANEFDIVHSHLFYSSLIAGISKKLRPSKSKMVITQHYTRSALGANYQKKLDRYGVRAADAVIAISSAVKSDLIDQGVEENRITVIPNGIDLPKFLQEAKKENHTLDDLKKRGKIIIGSIGNLHKRKDHLTLIKTMAMVVKANPKVHLVIAGEGPERVALEKAILELRLQESVSILGFQENIPSLISQFDLYVHPSINEPFGIAILEAMAATKIVIATRVDGVVDILDQGVTGLLVTAADPIDLSNCIIAALKDPVAMVKIAQSGRAKVEADFGIETTAVRYQGVYEGLVHAYIAPTEQTE